MRGTSPLRDEESGEIKLNKRVYIHPLMGTEPSIHKLNQVLNHLEQNLKKFFRDVVILERQEIPNSAFNSSRKQFNSTNVLKNMGIAGEVDLGILTEDIYANMFNFVFGEAELGGKKAVISIYRLKPEFYGQSEDNELLKVRTLKEAVHEIGHVLGLRHCPKNHCVMHFSNSKKETDIKDWRYCERCWSLL